MLGNFFQHIMKYIGGTLKHAMHVTRHLKCLMGVSHLKFVKDLYHVSYFHHSLLCFSVDLRRRFSMFPFAELASRVSCH